MTRESRTNPVDIHVGSRVRMRRTLLGLSQERLGDALGLTFQQVQKYERGMNRIGASRLYDLARILDVPVSFFFDEMPADVAARQGTATSGGTALAEESSGWEPDAMSRRETLELVRAYYRIRDPRIRRRLFDLVKSLGAGDSETADIPES